MEKRGFLEKFNAVGGYILLIGMFIMPIVMAANSRSLDYTERWGVFVMPIVMAANSDNISLYFILQMITLGMIVLGCFIIFIDFRKLKLNSLIKLFGYSVVVCSALLLVFGVMCALFLRQQYNIDFLDSFLSTIVSHIGQPILSAIAPHLKQPIEYYILFHDFTIKSLLGIVFVGLFIVLAKLWPVCMIAIGVIIFTCFFVFAADIGFNGYTFEFVSGIDTWVFPGATGEGLWRILQGIFYTFCMAIWLPIYIIINIVIIVVILIAVFIMLAVLGAMSGHRSAREKGALGERLPSGSSWGDRMEWFQGQKEEQERKDRERARHGPGF